MTDDHGTNGPDDQIPSDHLPYHIWIENAYRHVMADALDYAALNGLPGRHHFYIVFQTNQPGVVVPPRLKAQYPEEMTVVLQHQFWDLKVDREAQLFSVGLSFGGVNSVLVIPFKSVIAFSDPQAEIALRFTRPSDLDEDEDEEESLAVTDHEITDTLKEKNTFSLPTTIQETLSSIKEEDEPKEAEIINFAAFRKKDPSPSSEKE